MDDCAPAGSSEDRGGGALGAAVVFNVLIVAMLGAWWLAEAWRPESYYHLVSEDGPVEWLTFWALAIGVAANAVLAAGIARTRIAASWYPAGIALCCFLVAGEEISWGQRLIGYRPPEYFLSHNVQLEANLHNLLPPLVWSLGIEAIICGFGIVAPLLLFAGAPSRIAQRLGVYAPPPLWVPGWTLLLAFYVVHPFHLCEEVSEAGLGLGLAMAAVWRCIEDRRSGPLLLLGTAALAALLGVLSSAATEASPGDQSARVARARAELEALAADFVEMRHEHGGQFVTQCNLHVRLRTLDRGTGRERLHEGEFARLAGADATQRARYFLDPWNTPYWLSDQCDSAARYILLYSFGPNRKRESTHWEVGGDDIGAYAFHLGNPRPVDWRSLAFPEQP